MAYSFENVKAVQEVENAYEEMRKQSSVIVFDPARIRVGGGNPARPSHQDFFVDRDNCYEKAIEILNAKGGDFTQIYGRLLRKRKLYPTKRYFSVVRKRRGE